MDRSDIKVGDKCTYFPVKKDRLDNRHFHAVVEDIKRLIKIRIFCLDNPDGVIRNVSAKRLEFGQPELF